MDELQKYLRQSKNYIKATIIFIILVFLIGFICFFKADKKDFTGNIRPTNKPEHDKNAVDISPSPSNKTTDIEIPVYSLIKLESEKKEQKVSFINPNKNNCYFVISLFLPNKKLIYKSNLIAPGKAIYKITLLETIQKGKYTNATLKYECYEMSSSLKPLNGADFKIDLLVS